MSNPVKSVKYQLCFRGLDVRSGTVPVRVLTGVLDNLLQFAERELRLVIEGKSTKPGRPPAWLEKSIDLTVTGIETGSTVLAIEAPMLGETVGDQLRQQDFWLATPQDTDTVFSLITRSINDAILEDLESEYYDAGVLKSLSGLKAYVEGEGQILELKALDRPEERFALGKIELEKVERLRVRTPEPRACIVSGRLNSIEHRRKKFQLVVDGGEIIPGRIDEEFVSVEDMRLLWGEKVSLKGTVFFKPSGNVRLIEAQALNLLGPGEEIFQALPRVQTVAEFIQNIVRPDSKGNWLQDIWGRWPGDEPIEELLADLNN